MKKALQLLLILAALGGGAWLYFYKSPEEQHFAEVLSLAQQGDLPAQLEVGDLYANGRGVKANGSQAIFWYRKAALEGDLSALWKTAQGYIQGQLVPQDLEEAVPFLMLAAKQNHPAAQRELSRFYEQGLGGLTQSEGEGLFWLFHAAKNGDKTAQQELEQKKLANPQLYAQVEKFVADLTAAEQADPQARFAVGEAYQKGLGILPNREEAERWLTLAWQENKLPQAGLALAQLYEKGSEADIQKAASLWNDLAALSYPPAQYVLGERAYGAQPPKYEEAFAWFSNAASGEYAPGQYMTGVMLMQGQGTPGSSALAITFFRSAAQQNYAAAQYVLGQIYWKGLGVAVDKKQGRLWLEKAAQNGNTAAQELLNEP